MAIFNSYVKLPEGIYREKWGHQLVTPWGAPLDSLDWIPHVRGKSNDDSFELHVASAGKTLSPGMSWWNLILANIHNPLV